MLVKKILAWGCGIILLNDAKEIIDANEQGLRFISQMSRVDSNTNIVPREIQYLCESFIRCRTLFPDQLWLMETRVFIDQMTAFHLQVQWTMPEKYREPFLLVKIEDEHQLEKNFFSAEAQKYQLTTREREIWMLYRTNNTYKGIATKLGITSNTVKKHMKNILAKQKLIN